MDLPNEKILLREIADGNTVAFEQLVAKYWNNIYAQALAYLKTSYEAQDIVQDVFMKVWEKRADLPKVERFDSFLFIIARNQIISCMRKKVRQSADIESIEMEEQQLLPDRMYNQRKLAELIAEGVRLLPQQQQRAFLLSREQGLSHEEVAERMQLSKEAAKKNICRALNFLRTFLRTNYDITFLVVIYSLFFETIIKI